MAFFNLKKEKNAKFPRLRFAKKGYQRSFSRAKPHSQHRGGCPTYGLPKKLSVCFGLPKQNPPFQAGQAIAFPQAGSSNVDTYQLKSIKKSPNHKI